MTMSEQTNPKIFERNATIIQNRLGCWYKTWWSMSNLIFWALGLATTETIRACRRNHKKGSCSVLLDLCSHTQTRVRSRATDFPICKWIPTPSRRHSWTTTTPPSIPIGPALLASTRKALYWLLKVRSIRGLKASPVSSPVYPSSSVSTTSTQSIASPLVLSAECLSLLAAILASPANSTPSSLVRYFYFF